MHRKLLIHLCYIKIKVWFCYVWFLSGFNNENEIGNICLANKRSDFVHLRFSNCGWFGHSYVTRSQLRMSLIWLRWGCEFASRMNQFLSLIRSRTLCNSSVQTLAVLLKQSTSLRNIRCGMTVLSDSSVISLGDFNCMMRQFTLTNW